jgi:NADH-quinone oxidoreductase subunit G
MEKLMVRIIVDGKEYQVSEEINLLEAVLSKKLNLQYFCWHPALGSVGACRQCAVKKFKDENDKKGIMVMACMEPVTKDAIISIDDPEAKEFRAGIIEWLMINHPHDCPVCDEGGECHLQDMTLMSGHNYRRYRFTKRTYRNQYLGPLINHEMNRCIQCYRCVRYYRDYAEGNDFDAFGIHDNVYFGRAEEGVLENEFSGNLVEVCPTGVFTDKTLGKHYTRKWDLTNGPSICNLCSVGCNTIASERYGSLRRILTRYNSEVNGYFLCDRGRFGYEFVNSTKRVITPLIRKERGGGFTPVSEEDILKETSSRLRNSKTAAIGSPRASLESNFALMKLVGNDNFFSGIGKSEYSVTSLITELMKNGSVKVPSLKEIENSEAVIIVGEDVTNTAPMTALALRQASKKKPKERALKLKIPEWHASAMKDLMQNARGPFYIAHPFPTKLDDIATDTYNAVPDDIARFIYALANKFNNGSPAVDNIDNDIKKRIETITDDIKDVKSAVVVCGTSMQSEALIRSAYNLALAMNASGIETSLSFVVPECNSIGLNLLSDKNLDDLFSNPEGYENLIVLENDLYRREEKAAVDKFLESFRNIILIDHLLTPTADKADIILSTGTFAESDGTLISNEGRAQRFFQVYDPHVFGNEKLIHESWRWIKLIGDSIGITVFKNLSIFSDFTRELSSFSNIFREIVDITPPAGFRVAGQKIPRESHRFSGRTAMLADRSVHEPRPPDDVDSPLSFTMEGFSGGPPPSIIPFFWSPGWNSAQAINKYQIEIGGPLHGGDPGKRLFEPVKGEGKYFDPVPSEHKNKEGEFLALPLYHIFGSEEQSNSSMALNKLIPQPYVMISKDDARSMNLEENRLRLNIDGKEFILEPVVNDNLRKGILGIPFGLPGMEYVKIPSIIKAEVAG